MRLMVLAGNKAKPLSPVNYTTKTVHHHHMPRKLPSNLYNDLMLYIRRGICRNIQAFSALLRHIHVYQGIFRLIQGYSAPCVTFAYSQPCYIPNHEGYSKSCETLIRHLQNPAIVRTVYSSIVQSYLGILETLCNTCICRNLAYSEFWNTQYPSIIASHAYSELCHIFANR